MLYADFLQFANLLHDPGTCNVGEGSGLAACTSNGAAGCGQHRAGATNPFQRIKKSYQIALQLLDAIWGNGAFGGLYS